MARKVSKSYAAMVELIPDRLWILKYANKRSQYWYCSVYTGGSRKYNERSLKTEDESVARDKAYEKYADIVAEIKSGNTPTRKTIQNYCQRWIKIQEERVGGGKLSKSLGRAKRNTFSLLVPGYAEFRGWKYLKDIPLEGWNGYREWRMSEGWKLVGTDENGNVRKNARHLQQAPKNATVNREESMIKEWYRNLLVEEGVAQKVPVLKPVKATKEEFDNRKNRSYTAEDQMKIQRRFRKWANEKGAHKSERRQVIYHFFLICCNVGWRPDSEGLEQIWDNVKITKQKTQLPGGTEVDELIADMNIWDKKNKRERTGVFLAGEYFTRLANLYKEWHSKNEKWHLPNRRSKIFVDPETGRRISYSVVSDAFKEVYESLGMKGQYTVYSTRAWFITDRIKYVDGYKLAKMTGHNDKVMKQFYDESKAEEYREQITYREYGKKKVDKGQALF